MNVKEEIGNYLLRNGTVNIVISGITCSGKTTFSKELAEYFSNYYSVTIVSQENYLKNIKDIPKVYEGDLLDSIDAFHADEFKHDIELLVKNKVSIIPKYDTTIGIRITKSQIVKYSEVNIFEGLHTIQLLRSLPNSIFIFLDTDIGTCMQRRIKMESNHFGIPESRTLVYWDYCVLPMCEKYIFPQKQLADIIITDEGATFNKSKKF